MAMTGTRLALDHMATSGGLGIGISGRDGMGPGWTEWCTAGCNGIWLVMNHEINRLGQENGMYRMKLKLMTAERGHIMAWGFFAPPTSRTGSRFSSLLGMLRVYICFGYVCSHLSGSHLALGEFYLYEWMDGVGDCDEHLLG